MSMKWVKGKTKILTLKRAASVTFTKNSLVYFISGYVNPADSTSGDHIGIVLESVASTDSDFATSGAIQVEVPVDKMCEFEADVTGTLAATSVGVAMDLSTALVVNQGATSKAVVTCTKFITSTKGQFVLNSTFDVLRVATS